MPETKPTKKVLVKGTKVKVPPTPEEIRAKCLQEIEDLKKEHASKAADLSKLNAEYRQIKHMNLVTINAILDDELVHLQEELENIATELEEAQEDLGQIQ